MAAKAVAKKRAGGHIKPVPFVAPELPWRSKPEVEKTHEWSLKCTHGGQRGDSSNLEPNCAICPKSWALKC